ncbi:hypothetical protein [Amycolatopsis sp.]|uniref:hypothetical protein n=1 Tax=Amycolatopsis sp. TaxID=37632 RepID=UPI002C2D3ECA|nr:hypothetical protein [Amycolatopsis sp.]HVV09092.1 hypothetical protein [Amycolatopsis sp.]
MKNETNAIEIALEARETSRMALDEARKARWLASNGVLNALRDTQIEHGKILVQHGARLDALEREMREGFTEMREKFSTLQLGMSQITALLTNLQRER